MKLLLPILWPSRHTPKGPLQLLGTAHGRRGGWIHGAAITPAQLMQAFVIGVTEANQLRFVGRLAAEPVWSKQPVPFSAHTSLLFGVPLPPDRLFVHVAMGEQLTQAASLAAGEPPALEPGPLPGDLLLAAYDRAFDEEHAAAQRAFAQALAVPAVAADLEGAHRYNAACVAARAGDRAQALQWLADDTRARAAEHNRRTRELLLSRKPADDDAQVDAPFRAHVRHLRADPDLAGLPLEELLLNASR